MDAKEKAQELIHKYRMLLMDIGDDYGQEVLLTILSRTSALIAVDEIIQAIRYTDAKSDLGYVGYWNQVKQEIEKL